MNENIVKLTCKELGVTQKELAERLGVSKGTVDRWATSDDIPQANIKAIELLRENTSLKAELNELKQAFNTLKKYLKD